MSNSQTEQQPEPYYYLTCGGTRPYHRLSDLQGPRSEIYSAPIEPKCQGYDHFKPFTIDGPWPKPPPPGPRLARCTKGMVWPPREYYKFSKEEAESMVAKRSEFINSYHRKYVEETLKRKRLAKDLKECRTKMLDHIEFLNSILKRYEEENPKEKEKIYGNKFRKFRIYYGTEEEESRTEEEESSSEEEEGTSEEEDEEGTSEEEEEDSEDELRPKKRCRTGVKMSRGKNTGKKIK